MCDDANMTSTNTNLTLREMLNDVGDTNGWADWQIALVHDAVRNVARANADLLCALGNVRSECDATVAALNRNLSINEHGVLHQSGRDVERLCAVRHERVHALVLVLAALAHPSPSATANELVGRVS